MITVIVTGSTTGNTDDVADELRELLGAKITPAHTTDPHSLSGCDLLILGASTWDDGVLQDDMDAFLQKLAAANVEIPCAAIFGLGDQIGYSDTFVDGIADIAAALDAKGIRRIGAWPVADYEFTASRAAHGDHFMGLPVDQDNQPGKTTQRLTAWVDQLKRELAG